MSQICELLWMKQLLEDLKIQCEGPLKLFYGDKSTISIAHKYVQHDKTDTLRLTSIFSKKSYK